MHPTFSSSIYVLRQELSHFIRKVAKDDIFLYAGALSFNTLLAVIPLFGLIFSLARALISEETMIIKSFNFMIQLLPQEVASFVIKQLSFFLQKLKQFPLGKFSLVTYFMMSIGLLMLLENCLSKIFLSPRKRKIVEKLNFFWIILTISPFILLIPLLVQTYIRHQFNHRSYILFFFIALVFYLIYYYFPLRRLPKKHALISSILTTTLWFLLSFGFSYYIKYAVAYSAIYGSLSIIFFFFIWLFLNWFLFLLGAELAVFLTFRKKFFKKYLPYLWDKLILLMTIYRNFIEGLDLSIHKLEEELSIEPQRLNEILTDLKDQGLILITEGLVLPKRDLGSLTLLEVIEFPKDLAMPTVLSKSLESNFSDITVKDLVFEYEKYKKT